MHRLVYAIISSGALGSWLREHVIDPLIFHGHPVTWRNYEASYDVSELEPASRVKDTYVLQEYFVPADSIAAFVPRMAAVLHAHHVDVVNVSIRHALPDTGTYLAWAPTEAFAFVLYYRQRTDPAARREVGRWTRELVEAAIRTGGRYYLPYQPLATRDQFVRAYRRAGELFAIKRRVDPTDKFTNTLWDLYRTDSGGKRRTSRLRGCPAFLPAEVRMALDTTTAYARNEGDEYITHPEWDLVYSSEAYARWLGQGQKAERVSLRGVRGHVLAQLSSDLARQSRALSAQRRRPPHARRHRPEHGARVRSQRIVREYRRPTGRARSACRWHGGGTLRGAGRLGLCATDRRPRVV